MTFAYQHTSLDLRGSTATYLRVHPFTANGYTNESTHHTAELLSYTTAPQRYTTRHERLEQARELLGHEFGITLSTMVLA
jgi:hypothetical protein